MSLRAVRIGEDVVERLGGRLAGAGHRAARDQHRGRQQRERRFLRGKHVHSFVSGAHRTRGVHYSTRDTKKTPRAGGVFLEA
jgi:hypothetical protein